MDIAGGVCGAYRRSATDCGGAAPESQLIAEKCGQPKMAVPLPVKNPFRNVRVILLTAVLLVGAAILLLREQRASVLRPGLRLNAYVSTEDGSVAVVGLVGLRAGGRGGAGGGVCGMTARPN